MFDQQGVERTYKVQYAKKTSNRRDEYQMLLMQNCINAKYD